MDALGKSMRIPRGRFGLSADSFRQALRTPAVGLLLVLALGLTTRLWVVAHSPMAARDSIGFIRYALNLEEPPAGKSRVDVLRSEPHPPGYPAAILAMSWPVRTVTGETSCDSMVRAAQLADTVAAVLIAVPMFLVGRRLFSPGVALLAAALFEVLPVCVQITSDGLSDGLFLLTASVALWKGVRAFQKPAPKRFVWCGVASGLAYLVRPEGLMLAAAAGAVLLVGKKVVDGCRWRYVLHNGLALTLGTLAVAGPYMATIGKLSNKTTTRGLIDTLQGNDPGRILQSRPVEASARPGVNVPLAVWWNDGINKGDSHAVWATRSLASEVLKTFNYAGLPLALLGAWILRRRLFAEPAMTLLAVLVAMHAALLWLMAAKIGYVSQRHTLLIVLTGSFFAAAAIPALGRWLAGRCPSLGDSRFWTAATATLLIAASLPGGLKALHTSRTGHRAAGNWLANHLEPNGQIFDPFCWADFYAGRTMRANEPPNVHAGPVYVVLEPNSPTPHSRLPLLPQAEYIARNGEPVYHWPTDKPVTQAKVVIYRSPPVAFPLPADFPK